MITGLLALLDDTNHRIRINACCTLGEMSEKAATNKVINGLGILLRDTYDAVRVSASSALKAMGMKAATNEAIEALLDAYVRSDGKMTLEGTWTMERILKLLPCMSKLKADTVHKLSKFIIDENSWYMIEISPEKYIRAFSKTKIEFWLPIILKVFIMHRYAITITGMTIAVHSNKGSVEFTWQNGEIGEQLRTYFANWLDNSLKRCEGAKEKIMPITGASPPHPPPHPLSFMKLIYNILFVFCLIIVLTLYIMCFA